MQDYCFGGVWVKCSNESFEEKKTNLERKGIARKNSL